jgi:hypothetical protein
LKYLLLILFGASVTLCAQAQAFSDDFTRATDPGPLDPWTTSGGDWSVTGGALQSDLQDPETFAFAYVTNNWANYSVQARVRFSTSEADMGGIGGRLNPWSGGHYAAWLAPEGSPDGSNTLQLVKFQYWGAYEYTNVTWRPIAVANLPAVGTNWHTLKLTFQGNQITVACDGIQLITATTLNPIPTAAAASLPACPPFPPPFHSSSRMFPSACCLPP